MNLLGRFSAFFLLFPVINNNVFSQHQSVQRDTKITIFKKLAENPCFSSVFSCYRAKKASSLQPGFWEERLGLYGYLLALKAIAIYIRQFQAYNLWTLHRVISG